MSIRKFLKFLVKLTCAGAVFVVLLLVSGWVVCPDLRLPPVVYSEESVRAAESLRDISFDPDNPLVLYRDVDYSQGKAAPWYPKGESPILADLVNEGTLPPVEERVGPEPAVVEGVEGTGVYGGTWLRVIDPTTQLNIMHYTLSGTTLVRWSPYGYPIVPHVAKRFKVSEDDREFTFWLRKGMRWSDGHPFTADDIMYWWEHEINDKSIYPDIPSFFEVRNEPCTLEKVDDYCIRFVFPAPNGLFLARMADPWSINVVNTPAHFLRQYHPVIGDKEKIEAALRRYALPSATSLYWELKLNVQQPEVPRLWPWIYRTYKASGSQAFVRNPYYWMVDTEGNQLPYIDRILFQESSGEMVNVKLLNGEVSMQMGPSFDDYTHAMASREKRGYEVYHWHQGNRGEFVISPNLNLLVDPAKPETKKKHELMNDKRFRQALSLAIDRASIIQSQYTGQTEPAQVAPGPLSPFFDPVAYKAYTQYDPERANELLDEIGLTIRDYEGYRTFKDGSRMTFLLYVTAQTSQAGGGVLEFVIDDWAAVGIRVILRERSFNLFFTESTARTQDFNIWTGSGEFLPLLDPRHLLPYSPVASSFAIGYARWYNRGGLYDPSVADLPGYIEPPQDHPLRRAMEVYEAAHGPHDVNEQVNIFNEVLRIAAENVWTINIATPPPQLVVVKDGFRNVPRHIVSSWMFLTPVNAGLETYYFDEPDESPGAVAEIKNAVARITPRPGAGGDTSSLESGTAVSGGTIRAVVRYLILATFVLGLLTVAFKHPYVGRRLALMVPTLLVISIAVFTIIQLPPGDYLTARILQLEQSEGAGNMQVLQDLKESFHLEEPIYMQYARWLGLAWFRTFDPKDYGLLQGHLGRSMERNVEVNDLVGDRILLTICVSMGTILLTWALAIPVGIYSAVRQYSIPDYVLTFVGFLGMCVPPFLLALLLMYFSSEVFGIPVSGLFSSRYSAQPEWTWGKLADLMQHIWVPVVVMAVGGTAGMIRVMRGNLLDELKKPYVVTAMAKGVRPLRLLIKYPVRMALNPFISGIGALFPAIISGGAIVAVVLSLPTVGPLMLTSLLSEDMYMAGSLLMVLSLLGVVGTLVSDLLLLWLDPRIRFQAGVR